MALTDLRIPIRMGEEDQIVVKLSSAGDVEIRQLGQAITVRKEDRAELIDALIVAYKAVDQNGRRQQQAPGR